MVSFSYIIIIKELRYCFCSFLSCLFDFTQSKIGFVDFGCVVVLVRLDFEFS